MVLKVAAILLKVLLLPIGEASAGEGLHLQPAQQACCRTAQATHGLLKKQKRGSHPQALFCILILPFFYHIKQAVNGKKLASIVDNFLSRV